MNELIPDRIIVKSETKLVSWEHSYAIISKLFGEIICKVFPCNMNE